MTENDSIASAEFATSNGWEEIQQENFSETVISEAYEAKISAELSEDNLNGQTVKLKTNTEAIFAIADTKRPMSFLNKKSALKKSDWRKDKSTIFRNIHPEDAAKN